MTETPMIPFRPLPSSGQRRSRASVAVLRRQADRSDVPMRTDLQGEERTVPVRAGQAEIAVNGWAPRPSPTRRSSPSWPGPAHGWARRWA